MTDRRAFIGNVAVGLLAPPAVALAQTLAKPARIGILGSSDGTAWDGFRQGLRDLGYVEGRNLAIEWRWVQGDANRYPAMAKELVQMKVDLIVTSSTPAALAALQATSSIPIVMAISAYPERIGLVDSLAHPGGNVTGLSNMAPELAGKRLQLFKEMLPKASRFALVWNPTNPIEAMGLKELQAAGTVVGVQIQSVEVRATEDYSAAFAAVLAGHADAMGVAVNPVNSKNAQLIADFALKNQLPSSYDVALFVEVGGLWSYGASFIDLYQRAAGYVDKILKGARAGEMPIQQPTTFEFVINLKTAKAIGLTVPNSLLLRADRVIQ
jgi:putative tryptophan/tyrosine transport system substrate-binding protein